MYGSAVVICSAVIAIRSGQISQMLQTTEEIVQAILETGVRNVTLTGGEPLLTPNVAGLIAAITAQPTLSLEIETNGSVPLQSFAAIQPRPIFTMDYKLPSSGMEHKMCLENMQGNQCRTAVYGV